MLQRVLARKPVLRQRQNILGDILVSPLESKLLTKARKNLDLPTSCIYLLNSEKYEKFSPKTINQLLSRYAKKKPFSKMSLGSKKSQTSSKVFASNVKKFSYHSDSEDSVFQKSEIKLIRLLSSSYKHLEHLDASKLDIQNKPSLKNIAKLNHLQSFSLKLHVEKPMPSSRFFQNLRRLQHITLSIYESSQIKESDLAVLERVLHSLVLLPSLESCNIEIHSANSEQSESFIGAMFHYLTLLKAKRFSVKIHCSEALDLKVEKFNSFLESIDTLEYRYSGTQQKEPVSLQATSSKRLILILKPSLLRESFQDILNTCCCSNSLQNLSLEQNGDSTSPSDLKLPKTLKTLTLRFSILDLILDLSRFFISWEALLSSLNNLENLSLFLNDTDKATQKWVSQLPQCVPLKSLKQYHLYLKGFPEQLGIKVEYDSFITEWSRGLRNLANLESLSLDVNLPLLKSLDFFTDALASLSELKSLKLNLLQNPSQPKQTIEFCLPFESLAKLERIWLSLSQYVQGSAAKLLEDVVKCENLQSFNVSGLAFSEETAISALKRLSHLKELEIQTDTGDFLTINSKKKIIKHKAISFTRRMVN